jgi:hypothetical protein
MSKFYRLATCEVVDTAVQFHDTLAKHIYLFYRKRKHSAEIHIISILESNIRPLITYFDQTTNSTDERWPRSVLPCRRPFTSSITPWPLSCACAARLAAADLSALLSHLPTTTAIAPATVTAGCANIVPLAHADTPGSNTMPPIPHNDKDVRDARHHFFGCLAIK